MRQTSSCVPAVPKSATPTSGLLRRSKEQPLFDHLVGAGEQIDASFKNGILNVTLPKSPTAQQKVRRIAINGK